MKEIILIFVAAVVSQGFGKPGNIKVIGGQTAQVGQFPFVGSLQFDDRPINPHVCGFSILNERWVLTAAHCFTTLAQGKPEQFFAALGEVNLSDSKNYRINGEKICVNPKFDQSGVYDIYDIALMKLSEDIKFSSNIQPVNISREEVGSADITLCGWGYTTWPDNKPSDSLQYVNLTPETEKTCRDAWKDIQSIGPSQICTTPSDSKGPCIGDTGSPLITKNYQAAIASFGEDCLSGYPDIHTRVSFYYDWIDGTISETVNECATL